MDTDDGTFLNYFGDKHQNLLIQNCDENLGLQYSSLGVEQIFTDISDGSSWTMDGMPILLNGPLVPEDQAIKSPLSIEDNQLTDIYAENEGKDVALAEIQDQEISFSYPLEITGKGFLPSTGLLLSNDMLLEVNLQDETAEEKLDIREVIRETGEENVMDPLETTNDQQILTVNQIKSTLLNDVNIKNKKKETNGNSISILERKGNNSEEVIQLFNIDGSVITIPKTLLNQSSVSSVSPAESNKNCDNFESFYEKIVAFKCKKCRFVCEEHLEMIKHLIDSHKATEIILNGAKRDVSKPQKLKIQDLEPKTNSNRNGSIPKFRGTLYVCSECDITFTNIIELRDHMIKEHKLEPDMNKEKEKEEDKSDNQVSNGVGTSKVQHLTLVKKQQKAKKLKCSVKGCCARFSQDLFRAKHEECHVDGQKKQFKCPECNKLFSIWRICSSHMWKCHNIDPGLLTCPMCEDYKSHSAYNMLNHMAIHTNEYPFICSRCGKAFKQMNQLRNHQLCHKTGNEEVAAWASHQQCSQCGNFFADSKCLKKHVQQVHNNFKPFICNICGHKTTRKAMLILHLRQHTGEKPFKCSICHYKTGDHNSLRRHMMRHNGIAKYKCPHCEYKCIQSSSYKEHLRKKHPGQGGMFSCEMCSSIFVSEAARDAHMNLHRSKSVKFCGSNQNSNGRVQGMLTDDLNTRKTNKSTEDIEDDETQNCFLTSDHTEDTIDTGGITIPADVEIL